jgi:hypothetical protein
MTTQFEIGKTYFSQYNSGQITVTARTPKFVSYTEEINGESRKYILLSGDDAVSEGSAIVQRKKVKIVNDSEYFVSGICSYYATATNEGTQEIEVAESELPKTEAQHLGVTNTELKEAKVMACNYFNHNVVFPEDSIYSYQAILKGDCKSELPEPFPTSVKPMNTLKKKTVAGESGYYLILENNLHLFIAGNKKVAEVLLTQSWIKEYITLKSKRNQDKLVLPNLNSTESHKINCYSLLINVINLLSREFKVDYLLSNLIDLIIKGKVVSTSQVFEFVCNSKAIQFQVCDCIAFFNSCKR